MHDLSIVTDALRDILTGALATTPLFGGGGPPFSVAVSSEHPEETSSAADCDLNLFLCHVSSDRHQRNAWWTQESITGQPPGPARQPIAFEPLALDLFFILSARSDTSYVQEQQVMSVAMKALHDRPIVRLATPTPNGVPTSEITVAMETPTWDELSRLWQALNVSLRMTAQYRVSVALLTPESGAVAQPNPTVWTLLAAPTANGDGTHPHLYGTIRRVTFVAPAGVRSYDQTPASTAPTPVAASGQLFVLRGTGIQDTDQVFLGTTAPDGTETEQDVSAWKVPLATPYPSPPGGGVALNLRPPLAGVPPPGRYQLRLGRPTEPGWRSNGVPLSIAPWLDPAGGPLLSAAGGIYTCAARNVPGSGAELRLGSALLARVTSGTPAPGEWRLSGTTLTFAAPSGLSSGQHAVRLRAADVEADPALWAVLP